MLGFSQILHFLLPFWDPRLANIFVLQNTRAPSGLVFSPSFQAIKGAVFKNNQPKEDMNLANTEELAVGALPNGLSNAL